MDAREQSAHSACAEPPAPATPKAVTPKRRISKQGMQRIIAATKNRWAAVRAARAQQEKAAAKKTAAKKKAANNLGRTLKSEARPDGVDSRSEVNLRESQSHHLARTAAMRRLAAARLVRGHGLRLGKPQSADATNDGQHAERAEKDDGSPCFLHTLVLQDHRKHHQIPQADSDA